jgi:serine/threonine protein kinase
MSVPELPTHLERLTAALAGRYSLERELGEGGMATVYLAHDLKHKRRVALKVLKPELAAVLGAQRFLQEIQLTANLQHPHILPLFDSGSADGALFYVMPLVQGESLRDRLTREKVLAIDETIRITRQVAGALDFAHRQGIIHRDIKPENILLHDGEAMLADFGIALALSEAAAGGRLTGTGLSIGTVQYMSPEQAGGERDLDARSDVYSLGAVTYEMLAGEPPVTGPTVQAMIAKLMTERPTSLRVVREVVPRSLDAAVLRALAKERTDRFSSAREFADALTAPEVPARRPRTIALVMLGVLGVVGA